jgi:hypothetical protein
VQWVCPLKKAGQSNEKYGFLASNKTCGWTLLLQLRQNEAPITSSKAFFLCFIRKYQVEQTKEYE